MTAKQLDEHRKDSPLAGVKVLEFTNYIAGPFAGQHLSDFGADIIKIERPIGGDPFRTYTGGREVENYGVHYRAYNRNKKSITLDLQNPAAREIIKRLAADADVVLENFRPGVMDRLGIGYEALSAIDPGLIFCSISGFASDGPNRDRPAFDTVGQAMSGILYTFTDPANPKLRGPTICDQATALQASIAVMAALYGKKVSGEGAKIDVSMVDASISFIPDFHCNYTDAGIATEPDARASVSQAFIMRCGDDRLISFQLGGMPKGFERLCEAMGEPDLATDPRFVERQLRVDHWDELQSAMRSVFARHTRDEWEVRLAQSGIPYASVLSIPEVHEDPEVVHSQLFQEMQHPLAGPMKVLRRVAKIDKSRGPEQVAPALLGEHTESALLDAGFSQSELTSLRQSGAFGPVEATAEAG